MTTDLVEIVDAASTAVVTYEPPAKLAIEAAVERHDQIQEAMRRVLRRDVDYGDIPGTDKPALLLPGAESLEKLFRYTHRLERIEVERDENGQRWGVTYRCSVYSPGPAGDVLVATADGTCDYAEARHFQSREDRQRRENEFAERYGRRAKTITEGHKSDWNVLVQMAQKRAYVVAIRHATNSSGLFTSEIGDGEAPTPPVDDPRAEVTAEVLRLAREIGEPGSPARQRLGAVIADRGLPDSPAKMSIGQLLQAIEVMTSFAAFDQPAAGDAEATSPPCNEDGEIESPEGEPDDEDEIPPSPVPPSRTGRRPRQVAQPEPPHSPEEQADDDPTRPFE